MIDVLKFIIILKNNYIYKLPDGSMYDASIEDKTKVIEALESRKIYNDTKAMIQALRAHVFGNINLDLLKTKDGKNLIYTSKIV